MTGTTTGTITADEVKDTTTTEQPEVTDATAAGDGQGQPAPKTFTQDELDVILKERLARAMSTTKADVLKELGVEDVATAKKTLTDAEAARVAQMSELEKAQAQAAEAQAQAAQAVTDAEAIKAQAAEALLKAAIISQSGNLHNPMNAWPLMDRSKIKTNEDGTYEGIDEAIEALIKEQPHLAKADNGQPGPGTPARAKPKSIVEKIFDKNQQPSGEQPRRSTVKM